MINDWKGDDRTGEALEAMLRFHRETGRPPVEGDVSTPAGRRAGLPTGFAIDRIFPDGVNGWPRALDAYKVHLKTLPKGERPVTAAR